MDYRLFETLLSSLLHLCAWLCPNVSCGYIYALEDGINRWRNRICFEAYPTEASLSWSLLAFLILHYRLPFRKASLQECHIPPLLNMEWKRRCCLRDEIAYLSDPWMGISSVIFLLSFYYYVAFSKLGISSCPWELRRLVNLLFYPISHLQNLSIYIYISSNNCCWYRYWFPCLSIFEHIN